MAEPNQQSTQKQKQHHSRDQRQLGVIPQDGFMRLNQVLSVFPENRTSWYQGIAEGIYPPQVKLGGGRSSVWKASDIRELINLFEQGKTWADREVAL